MMYDFIILCYCSWVITIVLSQSAASGYHACIHQQPGCQAGKCIRWETSNSCQSCQYWSWICPAVWNCLLTKCAHCQLHHTACASQQECQHPSPTPWKSEERHYTLGCPSFRIKGWQDTKFRRSSSFCIAQQCLTAPLLVRKPGPCSAQHQLLTWHPGLALHWELWSVACVATSPPALAWLSLLLSRSYLFSTSQDSKSNCIPMLCLYQLLEAKNITQILRTKFFQWRWSILVKGFYPVLRKDFATETSKCFDFGDDLQVFNMYFQHVFN